ncbi:MAG: hypothetical protein V8Q43_05150 [Christensenellaceae bacterium]
MMWKDSAAVSIVRKCIADRFPHAQYGWFPGECRFTGRSDQNAYCRGISGLSRAGGRQTSISGALQERDILVPLGAKLKAPGVSMLPISMEEGFEAESIRAIFFSEEDILGKGRARERLAK